MSLGFRRQYETDAICDFAQIVKIIAADHPEDTVLQNYANRAKMMAIMLLTNEARELGIPGKNILTDRAQDCRDCEFAEKHRPCEAGGCRSSCKYGTPEYRLKAIMRYFGDNPFEPLEPYISKGAETP